jgi:1-acyl-sn-glycerol-3-phosphate acyltransferase
MTTARTLWKITRLVLHILSGLFTIRLIFPRLTSTQKSERIEAWSHTLLERIAIQLVVTGSTPTAGPLLLAANHISWLDIVVMQAAVPCRFVAKSDVRHWPLIGTLAAAAGTLFIARESSRDALRVVHQMAEHLQAGDMLAIFPEGTTSNGRQLLPFHANLFQAAIAANAPVLPVALQFSDVATGAVSVAPCYIDDDTLLASIWRTLSAPPLLAEVHFGTPQPTQGRDRRTLSRDIRTAVDTLMTG